MKLLLAGLDVVVCVTVDIFIGAVSGAVVELCDEAIYKHFTFRDKTTTMTMSLLLHNNRSTHTYYSRQAAAAAAFAPAANF